MKKKDYHTKEQVLEHGKRYHQRYPWMRHYYLAKGRCDNPNDTSYKYYGGKGIRFFLTHNEIHALWILDNAKTLRRPSIDRKITSGDYTFSNCRFIELGANTARQNLEKTHCKRGHEFTKENTVVQKKGRCCKICQKAKKQEWRERRKHESHDRTN